MNLQAIESELKEHLKVEARNALAEARAKLNNLVNQLKSLESGEAVARAEAYLKQVEAKVASLKNDAVARTEALKTEISNTLQEIEGCKKGVKDSSQAMKPAVAPAPTSSDSSASQPAPADQSQTSTPAQTDAAASSSDSSASSSNSSPAPVDNGEAGSAPAAASSGDTSGQ
jgi:multidrug resistance efflux pump